MFSLATLLVVLYRLFLVKADSCQQDEIKDLRSLTDLPAATSLCSKFATQLPIADVVVTSTAFHTPKGCSTVTLPVVTQTSEFIRECKTMTTTLEQETITRSVTSTLGSQTQNTTIYPASDHEKLHRREYHIAQGGSYNARHQGWQAGEQSTTCTDFVNRSKKINEHFVTYGSDHAEPSPGQTTPGSIKIGSTLPKGVSVGSDSISRPINTGTSNSITIPEGSSLFTQPIATPAVQSQAISIDSFRSTPLAGSTATSSLPETKTSTLSNSYGSTIDSKNISTELQSSLSTVTEIITYSTSTCSAGETITSDSITFVLQTPSVITIRVTKTSTIPCTQCSVESTQSCSGANITPSSSYGKDGLYEPSYGNQTYNWINSTTRAASHQAAQNVVSTVGSSLSIYKDSSSQVNDQYLASIANTKGINNTEVEPDGSVSIANQKSSVGYTGNFGALTSTTTITSTATLAVTIKMQAPSSVFRPQMVHTEPKTSTDQVSVGKGATVCERTTVTETIYSAITVMADKLKAASVSGSNPCSSGIKCVDEAHFAICMPDGSLGPTQMVAPGTFCYGDGQIDFASLRGQNSYALTANNPQPSPHWPTFSHFENTTNTNVSVSYSTMDVPSNTSIPNLYNIEHLSSRDDRIQKAWCECYGLLPSALQYRTSTAVATSTLSMVTSASQTITVTTEAECERTATIKLVPVTVFFTETVSGTPKAPVTKSL